MRVIISGGGTGGHIFPAIAIADALRIKVSDIDILFVGANGKMEMERVPAAGYQIQGLDIAGLQRKFTFKNLWLPFKLAKSMWQARQIIKSFKPDAVIGVGGYASGPIMKAATWANLPTFLQEQNSYAGVTNKLLAKEAKKIFVAYDGMERFFPKDAIMHTGNPVRKSIWDQAPSIQEARIKMKASQYERVVFICGGSLGARTINQAVAASEAIIKSMPETLFYWQVGKLYHAEYTQYSIAALPNVQVVAFVEDMTSAYAMADLVVSRAGALSISELCVVAKPVVLIPSPNVAEDHQTHNAMALVKRDAAVLLNDSEAVEQLGALIQNLLHDQTRLHSLSKNIKTLGKKDAASQIADTIINELKQHT